MSNARTGQPPFNIHEDFEREWILGFADARRPSQYDRNFSDLLANKELESEQIVLQHLQPWLRILEDSIQWLANLAAALSRLNDEGALDSAGRTIWVMVGASCTHAVAVRRLVLSGLDTPARAEARVLDEHLCACIAFLHDRKLAAAFQASQDKADAAQFWYTHLNSKALRKHLNAVERAVGLNPELSVDMRNWRAGEIDMFSQAVHPSYVGAALTTYTICAADDETSGPAFLGLASACSERTLNFTCKSIWYFCCFGFMMIFNEHESQPAVIQIDKDDEMHQMIVVGQFVLKALNRKYWSYEIYLE